jgi:hypothetical protein
VITSREVIKIKIKIHLLPQLRFRERSGTDSLKRGRGGNRGGRGGRRGGEVEREEPGKEKKEMIFNFQFFFIST